MLSIYDKGSPPTCPRPFNLAAHVLRRASAQPEKIALSVLGPDSSDEWSYQRLESAVRGVGTGLRESGLKPGEIVLMRLGNTVDFPLAYLGAIAAGLTPVPTSSQLTSEDVARIVAELSPKAILRAPDVASAPGPTEIDIDALQAMQSLPPIDYALCDPDERAYVVYTSGTSGKPRAVAHAHRAIWARQMMMTDWYGLQDSDRLLHSGAFNWTYTLGAGLMDPWTMGATALIPEPGTDVSKLPSLLSDHKATIFAAVPGIYRKLLSAPSIPDFPTLRHGLSAGEKLSEPLRTAWRARTGREIYEAFGMSECSTFISSRPGSQTPAGALGLPQVGRRVAIIGPDGPRPIGETGTIAVHKSDPGLMLGYIGAPEETAARFQDEWFLTGDQGQMDGEGYVYYMGRGDDMMNAGGFRVSPVEVENALGAFPGMDQVAVTEVEVKADAKIIMAFYTAPQVLDETDLRAFAEEHLARYKQPRAYVHVTHLPTNANGKVQRRALSALYKQDAP